MKHMVEARGITQLVHFTRVENLDTILTHGICPRRMLNPSEAIFNDDMRLDEQINASSFSISFPNYKMFYKHRYNNPSSQWVVLTIKPSILWEKDCAFCSSNAASTSVKLIPIDSRKGQSAFQAIFDDIENKPTRSSIGLKDHYTTDPQAEVLVFDIVESHYIKSICCESLGLFNSLSSKYTKIKIERAPHLFLYRDDYEHWR